MLAALSIRDIVLIDKLDLEFGEGLSALTGETGAGKSLLVDSLSLLAGSRPSTEMIRTGAEVLSVVGVFAPGSGEWRGVLRDAGLEVGDDESEIMVRREISRSGRNRVFINDQPATQRLLVRLAPLDQHAKQSNRVCILPVTELLSVLNSLK